MQHYTALHGGFNFKHEKAKKDKVYIALKYAKFNGRLLSVIEFENLMAQNEMIGSCEIKLVHPGWIKG